ncbi:hypothetical protein, partial [Escherichia albertii]|uniref:hypothetical protein n=1 Tax=Escherichia albertii TaxID=208962 RepID=UPI001A7E0D82
WKGWAILLRQKQKKLIMLPSETMIWQPEFTDKTLSRKPGAVQNSKFNVDSVDLRLTRCSAKIVVCVIHVDTANWNATHEKINQKCKLRD